MQHQISTPDWVRDAVFYQIFPDRFAKSGRFGKDYPIKPSNLQPWGATPTYHGFQGGDLLGIAEKLDYLVDLGINAIYLNPIFASTANHRYHTHDYFQVDPILGGNRAFKEFLDAAHAKGIRVILDGVFNHASRGFFQFNHLLECRTESPYADWFYVYGWPLNAYMEHEQANFGAWWGLHALPQFNTNAPAVREYLWSVATYWMEQGIDGWRLDVPNEINDDSFWQEFRRRVKAINPEAYIVGELWGEAHRWLQGDQFDAQMNYMFMRAVLGWFVGNRMDQTDTVRTGLDYIQPLNAQQFAGELNRIANHLYHPEISQVLMNMMGSHDTPRTLTIGAHDKAALRLMYLCQMTFMGAPNIYYGDEIGMHGGHDPYCRGAFPWHERESWDLDLLADLKRYIRLRHETAAFRRGDFTIIFVSDQIVVYRRQTATETAVVALNASFQTATFQLDPQFIAQPLNEKLVEKREQTLVANKAYQLAPQSGRVWVGGAD